MWNIGEYVCFDGPHQNGSAQNRNISSKRPPGRSRQFFSLALRVNLARQAVLDVKSYLLGQNKSILASPQCGTLGNTAMMVLERQLRQNLFNHSLRQDAGQSLIEPLKANENRS